MFANSQKSMKRYSLICIFLGVVSLVSSCGVDKNMPLKRNVVDSEPLGTQSDSAISNLAEAETYYNNVLKGLLTTNCAGCHSSGPLNKIFDLKGAIELARTHLLLDKPIGKSVTHGGGSKCTSAADTPCAEISKFITFVMAANSSGSNPNPEEFYNATLKPALTTKCTACHDLATAGADTFSRASAVAKSGSLLKIAGGTGHPGGDICKGATNKPCAEITLFTTLLNDAATKASNQTASPSQPTTIPTVTPQPTTIPTVTPQPTTIPTVTPQPTSQPTVTPEIYFSATLLPKLKLQSNCGGCHGGSSTIFSYNSASSWITANGATRTNNRFINRPLAVPGTNHSKRCTNEATSPCSEIVELGRLLGK